MSLLDDLKKQAEAIEEIYHLIVEIEEIFGRFVDLEGTNEEKDELRKKGGKLLFNFLRKYKKNRMETNRRYD